MVPQGESISREVLMQARELCGGDDRAAQELGVAPEKIRSWISGGACPPDAVVFAALVLIEQKKR